jgi:hypothetical protein
VFPTLNNQDKAVNTIVFIQNAISFGPYGSPSGVLGSQARIINEQQNVKSQVLN